MGEKMGHPLAEATKSMVALGDTIEIRQHDDTWVKGQLLGKTTIEYLDRAPIIEYFVRQKWMGRNQSRTVGQNSVRPLTGQRFG